MDDGEDQFGAAAADESLEIVEFGAEVEPLGGVAGDAIGGDEGGDDGGDFGAVLEEPIALQDSGGGGGVARVWLRRREEERDLGEVRQGQSVDRRIDGVEVRGDGGVELRAADD